MSEEPIKFDGQRVARICTHKDCVPPRRNFGSAEWECPEHGARSTVDQPNRPYMGLSTRPETRGKPATKEEMRR